MKVSCGVVVVAAMVLAGCCGAAGATASAALQQSASTVGQHDRLELTVRITAAYEDPFDPEQIDLRAVFTTPSGQSIRVPGFYYQPYGRSQDEDRQEVLTPAGSSVFKVRFAWGEVGEYRFEAVARDSGGEQVLGRGAFQVVSSDARGYVRRSSSSPLYFEFDSGDSYFPIGENMCWPKDRGTYDYDEWMPKLAASGGDYIRLWLINEWNELGLERLSESPEDGNGLGRYDQQAAWRIDYILDLAEKLGFEVLMCIESFNSLSTGPHPLWERYPYNAAHGGPCAAPPEFFTDPEAKRLFRQRLRYLVARWGYSTSVLAWEFWNEVDLTDGYNSEAVAEWHREMARYVRATDPWSHLLTTSFAGTAGDSAIDGLPDMDFVQSHSYGAADMAGNVKGWSERKAEAYAKPHYFGEFGVGTPWGERSDPAGIHHHNGLWAAMHSHCAGTPMTWWWCCYVEKHGLYDNFGPVAAFAEGIDWAAEAYTPAAPAIRYAEETPAAGFGSLMIAPQRGSWDADDLSNRPHTFVIHRHGAITNAALLSRVLHGLRNHPDKHNPATFDVVYPVPGQFEVIVDGVSGHGGASLSVSFDGRTRLVAGFPDDRPDDTETIHSYDGAYGIDVPPGRHSIVVENEGADWCYVSYRLTNYLAGPNLRALALSNRTSALLWVQNRDHTWTNHREGIKPKAVLAAEIEIGGFESGDYKIEQWDTYTGKAVRVATAEGHEGTIVVRTPDGLTRDVAYKIRRVEEGPNQTP